MNQKTRTSIDPKSSYPFLPTEVAVPAEHPSELNAARWSAAAEFQLQEIAKCVETAKTDVERVHDYAQTCLDDMQRTVKECETQMAHALKMYKLGVYDGPAQYATVAQCDVKENPEAEWPLLEDAVVLPQPTYRARDAVSGLGIVPAILLGLCVFAFTAIGTYVLCDALFTKPQPKAIVQPVVGVARVEADPAASPPAPLEALPVEVTLKIDLGEDAMIFLSSVNPNKMAGPEKIHTIGIYQSGEVTVPAGPYTFLATWRNGGIRRGEFEVKPTGAEMQTLKLRSPKAERET